MLRRSADTYAIDQLRGRAADRLYLLNDALLVADVAIGTVIGYLSALLYFRVVCHYPDIPTIGMMIWRELVLASVIASLVIRKADYRPHDDALHIAPVLAAVLGRAFCAVTTLVSIGSVTGALHDLARLWILAWGASFIGWMVVSRLGLLSYRRALVERGAMREAIALIGTPDATAALEPQLRSGADIMGVFDHRRDDMSGSALPDIVELARSGAIGLVVLAIGSDECPDMVGRIVDQLKATPIQVAVITDLAGLSAASPQIVTLGGVAMTLVADRPLDRQGLIVKFVMDKIGATLLLILASPLLIAIALAIVLETSGPIIFRQSRTGWCGRHFTVYKFRTMGHLPGLPVRRQTSRGDPRCTRIGAFLRRSSLDELPQLWNVLRGDMSLVGPRPHADFLHARERAEAGGLDAYVQRQRVKPGLTGWAQVHGYRGAADTPEKLRRRVELDLYYIEHWSIWLDLRILARTPWVVFSAENAF